MRLKALAASFSLSLFAVLLNAQIPSRTDTTATPVPGVGHDYIHMLNETVNPANGSLSIRIGVPVPPGRGITLPFGYAYDSNGVNYLGLGDVGFGYNSSYSRYQQGGWSYTVPQMTVGRTEYTVSSNQDYGFGTAHCFATINYVMQDAAGNRHNMNLAVSGYLYFADDPRNTGNCSGPDNPNADVLVGGEGPILATTTAHDGDSYVNPVTVTDADGTVYSFGNTGIPSPDSYQTDWLAGAVTDRNGNTVSIYAAPTGQPGNFSIVDSLGRTAISVNRSSNPDIVTVGGLANPYSVYWTTAPGSYTTAMTPTDSWSNCGTSLSGSPSNTSVSSIVLPNGQQYTFTYDPTYGRINKITYPDGGYVRYVWGFNPQSTYGHWDRFGTSSNQTFACHVIYDTPAVLHRFVSYDGVHEVQQQDFAYSTTWNSNWSQNMPAWTLKQTTVTTRDLVQASSFNTLYAYGVTYEPPQPDAPGIAAQMPVENTVTYYGTDGALLKTVHKTWANERLLTHQQNTLDTSGLLSETDWSYNANEQDVEQDDYDYGSGAPGALLRETKTSYWNFSATHIVDRPQQVQVCTSAPCSANNVAAERDYTYDSVGNRLSITAKCFSCPQGDSVSTYAYDQYGHVTTATDPLGHVTGYDYTDSFTDVSGTSTFAYLTKITQPVTNGVAHVTKFAYRYSDGQLANTTDQNQNVTSFSYNDVLGRLTETDLPDGGQTTIAYNDTANTVTTSKKLDTAGHFVTSVTLMDGIGHPIQSQLTSDPQGTVYSDTTYDGLGRISKVFNPYRSGDSLYYTLTNYDALGRVTSVRKQDNSVATNTYTGNATAVCDEDGHCRQLVDDGLGRLTHVIEPQASTGTLLSNTYYYYDALGNLTGVNQPADGNGTARTRQFTYDSLSQLLIAANPESGTAQYAYDADGNMTFKGSPKAGQTDPNVLTWIQYNYDQLHRVTQKSYNWGSPPKNFYYDVTPDPSFATSNGIGRLVFSSNNVNAAAGYAYDSMGRITYQSNCIPSYCGYNTNPISAAYNLAGGMTSLTYPSGRKVTQGFDNAGRLNNVTFDSYNGSSVNYNYWNVPPSVGGTLGFNPNGVPRFELMANSAQQWQNVLNNRLRISADALNSGGTILWHNYNYFANGNVQSIVDNMNSGRTQTFAYDYLNRITSAASSATSGPDQWAQTFTYDAFGNLNQHGSKAFEVGVNANNQTYDSAHPGNYVFDAAGNLTHGSDGVTTHDYAYDAEGQITGIDSGATTYTYDANGERVRKLCGTGAPCGAAGNYTEYIYFGGEPIAEKNQAGDWSDYIFAGGKRVAKADNFKDLIHIAVTNASAAGQYVSVEPVVFNWPDLTIHSGDKLYFRQYQGGGGNGGMQMSFTDGSWVAGSTGFYDAQGQPSDHDSTQGWHNRAVDLSSYAGKTISQFVLVEFSGGTGTSSRDAWFRQIVIVGSDGSVRPVYNGQTSLPWNGPYITAVAATASLEHDTNVAAYVDDTTTYYHGDQLGSARLMTSAGGWPVNASTYLPFGWEWNGPGSSTNHYKFTGKERDAETNNDYFGARYYNSSMGRWLSPDWSAAPVPVPYADLTDPQSLNLYGYVRNRPTLAVDRDGHCTLALAPVCAFFGPVGWTAIVVTSAALAVVGYLAYKEEQRKNGPSSSSPNPNSGSKAEAQSASPPGAPNNGDKGSNKSGEKTSRTKLRKDTVQNAWDKAADSPEGGKTCPDCGKSVKVEPNSGEPRDWDVNHDPKWSERDFKPDATRQDVIENYQEGTELKCPSCNRSDNQPTPKPDPPKPEVPKLISSWYREWSQNGFAPA